MDPRLEVEGRAAWKTRIDGGTISASLIQSRVQSGPGTIDALVADESMNANEVRFILHRARLSREGLQSAFPLTEIEKGMGIDIPVPGTSNLQFHQVSHNISISLEPGNLRGGTAHF